MATFSGVKEIEGPKHFFLRPSARVNRCMLESKAHTPILARPRYPVGKSFAEVVVGNVSLAPRRISVNAIDNEWLSRTIVAKLKTLSAMESVREVLHCRGFPQLQIKDMGELWVIVTFPSPQQMLSVFDGELSWLKNWFVEVKKWSPDLKEVRRRNIWISCYGVPLHCWSAQTFQKIAQVWGEVLTMDDATVKGYSFAAGKVMISTETWDRINEVIQMEVKGKIFEIRVVEEQVVIHGHCSVCNRFASEFTRVNSSPIHKTGNSKADSVDEVNSRSDMEHWEREMNKTVLSASANDVSRVVESIKESSKEVLVTEKITNVMSGVFPIQECGPKDNFIEEREIRDPEPHYGGCFSSNGGLEGLDIGSKSLFIKEGTHESRSGDSPSSCDSLVGESREAIDNFEDFAAERQLELFRNSKDGHYKKLHF
ncbi:hypothetical protein Vadar_004386 [Vaccinium darrowii]|uniref:Uncharacterized protein n=1 Tax=Vaccinium darrowii TaxID=229202 RepID=A0ACB7WXU5_9ERIC|nr:hypothetical protein Vadar_004386 [Vaccinium darrowii]